MKPLPPLILFILTAALSLASFMFVLDYAIANVSIPYISGDLAVSTNQGTYVITAFAVGNAIGLPLTGWLTKRVGAIRLICFSLLFFTFFSWTCGASLSFEMLVISRFLQGLSSGPVVPLSQTILVSINPPEKKAGALAIWSTIVIAGPIVGPILGGWISYDYIWPWIFYINVPIGLLTAGTIWFFLKKKETPREKIPIDWVGLLFLAIGVSCLQFLLDKGEQYDWIRSPIIMICAVTSFVCFSFLIVWSLTSKKPLIDLTLFKIRTFALSVFYIGVIYAVYFGSVVLVPLWLQTSMNYTSIWAGLAVSPIGIAPFLFGAFMGKAVTKWGVGPLLGICFIFFTVSCFYNAYFDTDVDLWHIGISRALLGCALIFFITPLFALSLQGVSEEKLPSSTGIFHFVRAMSGGIGTSIFTTMWTRRSAFHHMRLGESTTPYSKETTSYLQDLNQVGLQGAQPLAQLNDTVNQQAAMLGINDCFFVMGWVFLGLILLLPLCSSSQKKEKKTVFLKKL